MAHSHSYHDHDDVVIDRGAGFPAGALVALALVILVAVIGLAVLFSAPWEDDSGGGTQPAVPGINDGGNPGGGGDGGQQDDGGQPSQPESAPAQ
jgi:hypothetical protein